MITPYRITLTDLSSVTLNLNDGVQFANARFAPVVAPRQRSQLARGGPYQTVVQPLVVDVLGDTPQRAWANLATLIDTLDQADRWTNDESPVNPIYLTVKTTERAPEVQAEVRGYVGDDAPLTISEEFEFGVPRYRIADVAIGVVRLGLWESPGLEGTNGLVVSTSAVNPGIMTATMPSAPTVPSRYRFGGNKVGGTTEGWVREGNPAFTLLANNASKLLVIDSASFTFPAGTVETADAANNPLGGTVKRVDASVAGIMINFDFGLSSFQSTLKRRVALFAAVRNNSASATFFLQGEVTDVDLTPIRTRPVEIVPNGALPQIVALGTLNYRWDLANPFRCQLYISATLTSAAHTLDIDYVALICLDEPLTDRVIATGTALTAATQEATLIIEPGSLQPQLAPVVLAVSGGQPHGEPYRGDAYLVSTGNQISALLLSTNGNNFWRIGGSTANTLSFTVRRRPAYRTPPGS